jgi:hypothetical protein
MRFSRLGSISAALVLSSAASMTFASPARDIRVPPVVDTTTFTSGPSFDPTGSQGQWFQTPGGFLDRPYEFYDNITGSGGSVPDSAAITGIFNPLIINPGTGPQMSGFTINASVTNNLPGLVGTPLDGTNAHSQRGANPYRPLEPMRGVVLTAEFSMIANQPLPLPGAGTPYTNPTGTPIIANSPDALAWYSWSSTSGPGGPGRFQVPSYFFADIAPGATVSRTMSFSFQTPIPSTSAEFTSYNNLTGLDVFLNRSTDLKIGDWLDNIALDSGAAYPFGGLPVGPVSSPQPFTAYRSGNVSVFYIPEPATIAALAAAALVSLRRRR